MSEAEDTISKDTTEPELRPPSPLKASLPAAAWLMIVAAAAVGGFILGTSKGAQPTISKTGLSTAPDFRTVSAGAKIVAGGSLLVPPKPSSLNDSFADLAEKAGKSVVSVYVSSRTNEKPSNSGLIPYFYGRNARPGPSFRGDQNRSGNGSGLILRPDGYIVTNSHVIRYANEIKVILSDRREFQAKLVGKDNISDLALLKIEAQDLPAAKLAETSNVRPGDVVLAIGSPMRLDHTVSQGIVSAVGRNIGYPFSAGELIQTDAAINPGSSGGPLLNLQGEVIGINTIMRADAQGIAFAVPSSTVKEISKKLMLSGRVCRAYMGLKMADIGPEFGNAAKPAVIITYVHPESPAQAANLRANDIIEQVSGETVSNYNDVKRLIQRRQPGDEIEIAVSRSGQKKKFHVKLAEMPTYLNQ